MSDNGYSILDKVMNGDLNHLDAVSLLNSEYNQGKITEEEKVKLGLEIEEWYEPTPSAPLRDAFKNAKNRTPAQNSGGGGR